MVDVGGLNQVFLGFYLILNFKFSDLGGGLIVEVDGYEHIFGMYFKAKKSVG